VTHRPAPASHPTPEGTASQPALRLALLTSDDAHHRYCASLLAAHGFCIDPWIVEPASAQRRRRLARRRWRDWAAFEYHHWRRTVWGLDAYRRRYFRVDQASRTVEPIVVDWINSPVAINALSSARHDLTVVMGTSILNERLLQACGGDVVNVHGGMLPHYRGNHCFWYALENGDLSRIGSTIHFVDRGIDTGDIIEVVPTDVRDGDLAEHLYCRAEKAALHRLAALLTGLAAGEPLPRSPQPSGGRTYRTRDRSPRDDVNSWFRRHWRRRAGGRGWAKPRSVGPPALG
jgi:hypothetical protein